MKQRLLLVIICFFMAACTQVTATPSNSQIINETLPPTATTVTASAEFSTPTGIPSPTQTPAGTVVPTQAPAQICAPLEDLPLDILAQFIVNPFATPNPFQDDGHHGVDFAFWSYEDRVTMVGLKIFSILPGKISAAITDRPPYGNFVIVETPLAELPASLLQRLSPIQPIPTPTRPDTRLTCPADLTWNPAWDANTPSLYMLYAHMETPPELAIGQQVACGEQIGAVGNTGMSGNPHLHLEARIGPAHATFTEMAHYTPSVTEPEMRSYCLWRASGIFALVNPLLILDIQP